MLHAICRYVLPSRHKNTALPGLVSLKKLQLCYSTVTNLWWYCSTIVKQNNIFFIPMYLMYLPLSLSSFSLFLISLSFSTTFRPLSHHIFVLASLSLIKSLSHGGLYWSMFKLWSSTRYHCLAWVWWQREFGGAVSLVVRRHGPLMEVLNLASDDGLPKLTDYGLWFFWRGSDDGLWCVGGLKGYGFQWFWVLWCDGGWAMDSDGLGVVVRWWQGYRFWWLDFDVCIPMVLGVMVWWFEGLWILIGFGLDLVWLVWVNVVGNGGGLVVIGLFLLWVC